MEVLHGLFEQIANIDSTVKLIAFLASILVVIVIVILKNGARMSKRVANILIFLFSAVVLIACLGMILPMIKPGTLTLTLTLTNTSRRPYTSDQADFIVNSKKASVDYSPLAKSWTIVFAPGDLPKDRTIYLSAQTKDTLCSADTLLQLTNDPVQTPLILLLQRSGKDTPPIIKNNSATTFWINLSDETIRKDIANLTGLTYDPATQTNKIVISYQSSKIHPNQGTGTYSFVSSSPVVRIDKRTFTLDNCSIPGMAPNYTSNLETLKNYAQTKSMEVATAFFRNNPEVLARWIKQ